MAIASRGMAGFPLLCVLMALPFLSCTVIVLVPRLRELAAQRPRATWAIGAAGLIILLAGLVGALPRSVAVPLMLAGGAVSGFAMFWPREQESHGDDEEGWRGWGPAPEEPPRGPLSSGPNWELFDILRAEWEQREPNPGIRHPVQRAPSPGLDE